jgi:hypothetical protein
MHKAIFSVHSMLHTIVGISVIQGVNEAMCAAALFACALVFNGAQRQM